MYITVLALIDHHTTPSPTPSPKTRTCRAQQRPTSTSPVFRTFRVQHTESREHMVSVTLLLNVLLSYRMCCPLTLCVAHPIWGVYCSS